MNCCSVGPHYRLLLCYCGCDLRLYLRVTSYGNTELRLVLFELSTLGLMCRGPKGTNSKRSATVSSSLGPVQLDAPYERRRAGAYVHLRTHR
jgi:hypothetical protein